MYKDSQHSVTMPHVSTSLKLRNPYPPDREHVFLLTSVSAQHSLFTADTFSFLAWTYVCNTHKRFSKGNVSSTIGAHENEGKCCLRRQETLPRLFCVIELFDFKGSK